MHDFKDIITPFGGEDHSIIYSPGLRLPWRFIHKAFTISGETFQDLIEGIKTAGYTAIPVKAQEKFHKHIDAFLITLVNQRDVLQHIIVQNIKAAHSPIEGTVNEALRQTVIAMKACGYQDRELGI